MMSKQRFKHFFKKCKVMAIGTTSSKLRIRRLFSTHNGTIAPGEDRSHLRGTFWAFILLCMARSHCISLKLLRLWILSPNLEKVVPSIHTVGSPLVSFCLQTHIILDRALLAETFDRSEQASHNAVQQLDPRRHSARPAGGRFDLDGDIFQCSNSSHFQNGRSIREESLASLDLICASHETRSKHSSKSWYVNLVRFGCEAELTVSSSFRPSVS